ncbi:hypothetical protein [Streptomyces sp. NPDC048191]|uniref:hypothetical protein n=1 Tax=Streptomyces sp. NPDC048191 TaxID=3155484 RepID=UPI0033DB3FAC
MGKGKEKNSPAEGLGESPLELEPDVTGGAPEFASLSPELEPWQAESIAAELSPDITFDDAPE